MEIEVLDRYDYAWNARITTDKYDMYCHDVNFYQMNSRIVTLLF